MVSLSLVCALVATFIATRSPADATAAGLLASTTTKPRATTTTKPPATTTTKPRATTTTTKPRTTTTTAATTTTTTTSAPPPPPAVAEPGIRASFAAKSLLTDSQVMGGQIVLEWSQIEPSKGVFCWDNPRTSATVGCGTKKSDPGRGLDAQLAYYKQLGKEATVQVNSSQKPTWIYASGSGVQKCGAFRVPQGTGSVSYDVPMYWNADGTLNQKYFTMMSAMLTSFAKAISASPYASVVSGVRASPNLVGTEFRAAVGGNIKYTKPKCSAQSAWKATIGASAYAYVMQLNYNVLEAAGIRPILREGAFTNLGASNLDPTKYLEASSGPIQPWYFATSSNPDVITESKDPFDEAWARTGLATAYDEVVWSSNVFNNPVSWNYWNVLMNLDRGTSYIAEFGTDVALSQKNPEYAAAYDFANTYAGYNTPSGASVSPGAWIAFAPNPGEIATAPTRSLTNGDLGMFMSEDTADGSVERDSLGTVASHCAYDTTNNVCAGVDMIGSPLQRFGRWARETNLPDSPSLLVNLDDTFKASLPADGDVEAYVTYLDCGGGTWTLDWGGGSSDPVTTGGSSDCSSSTDQWVTAGPIDVPVAEITRTVNGVDDFGLTSSGGNVIFHMLEVRRPPASTP
ncbi:MAG TPA: hypothetical protein VGI86_16030 [Acidimicrobiia bacterium]